MQSISLLTYLESPIKSWLDKLLLWRWTENLIKRSKLFDFDKKWFHHRTFWIIMLSFNKKKFTHRRTALKCCKTCVELIFWTYNSIEGFFFHYFFAYYSIPHNLCVMKDLHSQKASIVPSRLSLLSLTFAYKLASLFHRAAPAF